MVIDCYWRSIVATKIKTVYFCQNCGYESSKWMGQCPGCKNWNTFVEETVKKTTGTKAAATKTIADVRDIQPMSLSAVSTDEEDRDDTHITELNRVLGGGLVRGSLTLVGGDPGIGKSTLML
jgi:DNA repair protein RadA/Sms